MPICTFLSSGIDSSLTTSIASQTLKNKISTFTIKFDQNINMIKIMMNQKEQREIASYLNTNHTEFTIRPDELIDAVEKMNNIFRTFSVAIKFLLICFVKKSVKII